MTTDESKIDLANLPDRLVREIRTIRAMMRIYCKAHHSPAPPLCEDCRELLDYAEKRLAKCPHGADKPSCRDCTIHCYQEPQATQVREVMRYAGPRMIWRHPILAIRHLLDSRSHKPVAR